MENFVVAPPSACWAICGLAPGLADAIEPIDHPLPRQHTRLDATSLGDPTELFEAFGPAAQRADGLVAYLENHQL